MFDDENTLQADSLLTFPQERKERRLHRKQFLLNAVIQSSG